MEYKNFKFLMWYTRAIGGLIGLYTCIYCYLSGDMIIYQNLDKSINNTSFNSILASYALLPLCVVMILVSLLQAFDISSKIVGWILSLATVTIGFIGCKEYFLIAGIVVILNVFIENAKYIDLDKSCNQDRNEEINLEHINIDLSKVNKDIVIDLLENKVDKNFIMNFTGLNLEDIDYIEKNYK